MTDVIEDMPPEEAVQEEEAPAPPDLASLLAKFDGAPNAAKLEEWKQKHGEIFCSGFSDTELFVWRPLSRKEYVALQKQLRGSAQNPEPMSELDYEDLVVKTCILWASVKDISLKGGSISTLSEQILMNSNFMAPAMAAQFVLKL